MKKNKCRISFNDISLYVDNAHSQKKREALKAHFDSCPHCKKSLEQAESLKASLLNMTQVRESAGFDFEFNRLLDERIEALKGRSLQAVVRSKISAFIHSLIIPMPLAAKAAVSLSTVVFLVAGLRYNYLQSMPFVEFSAGDVRIYRQSEGAWARPYPNFRLRQSDKIELKDGALINLVVKGKYKARVKDNSLIVISRLGARFGRLDTDFSLSYGKLLVNTTDKFKGSNMKVFTPACQAEIVGTAFMIEVSENNTLLGVLEGSVKLVSRPHPLKADRQYPAEVYVNSGQKAFVKQYASPSAPELCSRHQWKSMLELYQLVENPQVILLIGTGVDRVDDLLGGHAPVYIPDSVKRSIPQALFRLINAVSSTEQSSDPVLFAGRIKELLQELEYYPDFRYKAEILMFIASNLYKAGDHRLALDILEQVAYGYPGSEMAGVAWSGAASIYQHDLNDISTAKKIYADLIYNYPDSSEAIRASEMLSSIS
ncbi:MAG: FecR domain-containing protein [Candidatus Omnitrophica bacterium]|nr:FecR domain-containing protein [Candidatus Omnitrophota bacterium]